MPLRSLAVGAAPMHREWNARSFFRRLAPPVLERLCRRLDLPLAGDGAPHEHACNAWLGLPEQTRLRLETELAPVNDMCSPHARPYLEGALSSDPAFAIRELSAHDLAVSAYLDARPIFDATYARYAVDCMESFKEYRGRWRVTVLPSEEKRHALEEALRAYLKTTAYGERLQVEAFGTDEKVGFFVFHEDEITAFETFNKDGVLEPDWRRPVVKLAVIFHFASATLLVKAHRTADRDTLRDLFARVVVGHADYFEDAAKQAKFRFDVLRDPDFRFGVRSEHEVESVSIVKLVLRPAHADARRLTLELQAGLSVREVHRVLTDYGIEPAVDRVEAVSLQFRFQGRGRSRLRTAHLRLPNSSNLSNTRRDEIIRRHLQDWGIDAAPTALAPPSIETAAE
jgi:hypothetical protein